MPSTSDSVARLTSLDSIENDAQVISGSLTVSLGQNEQLYLPVLSPLDNVSPIDLRLGTRSTLEWRELGDSRSNGSEYSNQRGGFTAIKEDGSSVSWGSYARQAEAALSGDAVQDVVSTMRASAGLKVDGSVVTWGDIYLGGEVWYQDMQEELSEDVQQLFSGLDAFTALKNDGSVITWGSLFYDDRYQYDGQPHWKVENQKLVDVRQIVSSKSAFAALQGDGSVVTWGLHTSGANSNHVDFSGGVRKLVSSSGGFAAIKNDHSVVSWGYFPIPETLDLSGGVQDIFANDGAFAALKKDGSVMTWGSAEAGGDSSNINFVGGVRDIVMTPGAFAAIKNDGSVVTWGDPRRGGSSEDVDFSGGVHTIVPSYGAFAAIKNDGSAVAWGGPAYGGNAEEADLSGGITDVVATFDAFAAIKHDGSVVTWGDATSGGDSRAVDFSGGVRDVFSNGQAFAAIKHDGSVVTWGAGGGDSSSVAEQLSSGVVAIPSSLDDEFINVSSFNENLAANSLIARFRSTDPNPSDRFTYSLVPGEGDRDNTAFTIENDQLRIKQSPDYEAQSSYSIRVRTTDSAGGFYEEAIALSINDIVESSSGGGSLDSTFGNQGWVTLDFAGKDDVAGHVLSDRDGKIVVIGNTDQLGNRWGTDWAIARYNSDGSLDESFGNAGIVLDRDASSRFRYGIVDAIEDPIDGGLLLASTKDDQLFLRRYNSQGKLDIGFGNSGEVGLNLSENAESRASAVTLDALGNILLAGDVKYPGVYDSDFGIVRYTPAGLLDTSFGTDGKVLTDFNGGYDLANTISPTDTGFYVTGNGDDSVGFRAARYFNDGCLDTSFGNDGQLIIQEYVHGSEVDNLGRLLAIRMTDAGASFLDSPLELIRFNLAGDLDPSFGDVGRVPIPGFASFGDATLAVDGLGQITVSGMLDNGNPFLTRYLSNGQLNRSFGTDGIAITDFDGQQNLVRDITLDPNGNLLLSGSIQTRAISS